MKQDENQNRTLLDAEQLDERTQRLILEVCEEELNYYKTQCEYLEQSNKIFLACILLLTFFNILMSVTRVFILP